MLETIQSTNLKKLCRLLFVLPAMLLVILAWTATDELVTQLRIDYDAFRAAEDDYRSQRELNGLDGEDAADYAAYVASLQRRVFEDCQDVLRSGSPFPDDLPCPVIIPPVTQSADIATQQEQTPEEQIAALDEKLNAGLGEYDERLLREQERIKASAPNNNADRGTGGGAGDGSGDPGFDTSGESQEPGEETANDQAENTDGQQTSGPGSSSPGAGAAGKDADQPPDIPDGSDDDIVARQLREAAEKETDPELKAKLWEEYRRYKLGTK